MERLFDDADRKRISEAVQAAEKRTAGEIVPYIVASSGRYDVSTWRAASLLAVVALAISLTVIQFYQGWGLAWLHAAWGAALVSLLAGTMGAALGAFVPAVKRALAGRDNMEVQVRRHAMQAFVEEEVFDTRDRTGILIFISLLERRIEVVGDAGINALVEPDEWADVVETISEGIRSGRATDGIVEAVDLCGRLLEKRGVEVRADDTNELPNRLRFGRDE